MEGRLKISKRGIIFTGQVDVVRISRTRTKKPQLLPHGSSHHIRFRLESVMQKLNDILRGHWKTASVSRLVRKHVYNVIHCNGSQGLRMLF